MDNRRSVYQKIVFSGDIGNVNRPIIKDPKYITEADYVVMESTYGDRYHNASVDYVKVLAEITQRTFDRGGNVVIPSLQSEEHRRCCIISDALRKKYDTRT